MIYKQGSSLEPYILSEYIMFNWTSVIKYRNVLIDKIKRGKITLTKNNRPKKKKLEFEIF